MNGAAECAVELGRVSYRFVDREVYVRGGEYEVLAAGRRERLCVAVLYGLGGDPFYAGQDLRVFDVLEPYRLKRPVKGAGLEPRFPARACGVVDVAADDLLLDIRALGRSEILVVIFKLHRRISHENAPGL